PDGPIYVALLKSIHSPLYEALTTSSTKYDEAIKLICEALKNVISKIVDFMPRDGVLGSSQYSAISALIQDGNHFPDKYFWQCERKQLEFNDSNEKTVNVTKQRATLLLIGVFIFRALVTTLLCKPIKYRLMLGEISSSQQASLKILATLILYIGRRVCVQSGNILVNI
ncbi:unnamed protein product, partial [Didymodactylos carnosus]